MDKNLKDSYVQMPESFHNRIEETLESLDGTQKQKIKKFPKAAKVILIAAVITAILTVSAFAGDGVYKKWIEKKNYQVSLSLDEETSGDIHQAEYVKLNFGYMSDYIVPYEPPYKYHMADITGEGEDLHGFTFALYKTETAKNLKFNYAVSVEERKFGTHDGAIIHYESVGESSRDFIIYFNDYGYVLYCFVGESVSDEDMIKVAENLSLEETDREHAMRPETNVFSNDAESESTPEEYVRTIVRKQIGEAFERQDGDFSITVTGTKIYDNISSFDRSSFNIDQFDKVVDENGNFKKYEREIYEYGDGINTLDELKEVKTVGRKLLCIDLKVTNRSGTANEFNAGNTRLQSGGNYEIYRGETSYISGQNGNSGRYYFVPFEVGEEKTVTIGFIIDDDTDLSRLAVEFDLLDRYETWIQVDLSK